MDAFSCIDSLVPVAVSFTSPPGGNKVDGLPPASSFGPMCGKSVFIWLVFETE